MLWAWVGGDRVMKGGTPGGRHSVSKGLKVRVAPVGCGEREFILIHGLRFLGPWLPLLPHPHAEGHSPGALDPPSRLERQHSGSGEGRHICIFKAPETCAGHRLCAGH